MYTSAVYGWFLASDNVLLSYLRKGYDNTVFQSQEAALALANATQERLELENKLMVLEAKKEQMDTLLRELQSLKEAQLRKGIMPTLF